MRRSIYLSLLVALVAGVEAQQTPTFNANSNLVIVDTFVKNKSGQPIPDLTKGDFTILENGKPQKISVFEYQKLDSGAKGAPSKASGASTPVPAGAPAAVQAKAATPTPLAASPTPIVRYQDKRLIAMYFDFSSMGIDDQMRIQKSALHFIETGMKPSDLVCILAVTTGPVEMKQDFTSSKDALEAVIRGFHIGEGSDLVDTMGAGDTTDDNTFSPDLSEFDIFNTDRKLVDLQSVTNRLSAFPEKKVLMYFTGGITQSGTDNQAELLKAVNTAAKSNVAIDPIDARGMTASGPGGDATQASGSGSSLFTGSTAGTGRQSGGGRGGGANDTGLETLSTLASDTGGQLFSEDNDFAAGMEQARDSITSYYILGYYSTDGRLDGKYRTVEVKLNKPELKKTAKLDYRHGYFGQKEFGKFTTSDREEQLQEALMLGDPLTDLNLKGEVDYFRLARGRYYVPFSVKIPGSEIALAKSKGNAKTELEFVGQVRNQKDQIVASVRDAIDLKLNDKTAEELNSRPIAYDTGFTLPPGEYSLKFLTRENETGKMGTWESKFTIPDLAPAGDRIETSSVVLSSQRLPVNAALASASDDKKAEEADPLVQNGVKLVPSITRVFRKDQNLYVYMEVYDPAVGASQTPSVAATVSFYRGRNKLFESQPVRMDSFLPKRGATLPVELKTPLAQLPAGEYTCQVNLIDEAGRKFAFERLPMAVLPASAAAPAAPSGGSI